MTLSSEQKQARLEKFDRNRRKWYNFYFFMGVGINFILYFTKPYGFDPGGSIFWGSLYGIGIPLCTMFLCVNIHEKILSL